MKSLGFIVTLLFGLTMIVGVGWPVARHNWQVAEAYWFGP